VIAIGQVWTLIAHQLSRRWRSILAWGVGLGALGALYVALYPSMSGLMDDFVQNAPESLKRWLGNLEGPMTPEQWMGMEFLNLFIPLALPFLVMLIGARTVAGDEERKNLDLLLGNPLRRRQLIVGAVGTMIVALTAVLALTWVLTYIAVPIAGVDLAPGRLATALVALWPMCLLFGTFALFLSTLVRRAFLATVIPAVILVIMYLVELLAQLTETMEPARVVSLFYHIGKPIEGDFHLLAVLLMLAGACVLSIGAAAAFSKRDIYT
jgi:ABC-2 type transport system permease protein